MLNAKLVVVGGGDASVTEIQLKLPTTIGRSREAKLKLPHPLVSRKHCEVFEKEGQLFVRDLGSLNGTYVDNHKIESEHVLAPDHLLTLGTVTFRAVYEPAVVATGDLTFNADANPTVPLDEVVDRRIVTGQPAFSEADTERDAAANDTDTNLPKIDASEPGKNDTTHPGISSSIFIDSGEPPSNGSVVLDELAKLPSPPAALSFAGGIQVDDSRATQPAPVSEPLPTIDVRDEAANRHPRRKRPR